MNKVSTKAVSSYDNELPTRLLFNLFDNNKGCQRTPSDFIKHVWRRYDHMNILSDTLIIKINLHYRDLRCDTR